MIKIVKGENGKYGVVVLCLVRFELPQSIIGTVPPALLILHNGSALLRNKKA